jgi:hypothetical protein
VTVERLIAELRRRDVEVEAYGAGLLCSARPEALTPDLKAQIVRWKIGSLGLLDPTVVYTMPRAIVPIEPRGTRTPVFAVPGHDGDVLCYGEFVKHLDGDRPFFGLEPPGLDGHSAPLDRIEDLAEYFEEQIATFLPPGPRIVAGYGAGGTVAFELGRRLAQDRRDVLVALLASPHPGWYGFPRTLWTSPGGLFRSRRDASAAALEQATIAAVHHYRIRPLRGRLALFVPNPSWLPSSVALWSNAAPQTRVYSGPPDCRPDTMLSRHSSQLAALFRQSCEEHETSTRH